MGSLENNPYTTMRGFATIGRYGTDGSAFIQTFRTNSVSTTIMDPSQGPLANANLFFQQTPPPDIEALVLIDNQGENTLPTSEVSWVPTTLPGIYADARAGNVAANPPTNLRWDFYFTDSYGNTTNLYIGNVLTTLA